MIPLLLVSANPQKVDEYITTLIETHNYPAYRVHRVIAEKKELSIEQIRGIQKEVAYTSASRLFIIYDFQTASIEAQNALLKTLEEKTEINHFILVTSSEMAVLPTIRSRAKTIRLESSSSASYVPEEIQTFMKNFAQKDISALLSDPLLSNTNP